MIIKRYFNVSLALLSFAIGVIITTVWLIKLYSPKTNSSHYLVKSVEPTKRGLPCLVKKGDIERVKELLASGLDVDSLADSCIPMEPYPRGVTLLMEAAGDGDKELVKFLLENRANVNASNSWDDRPLSYAVGGEQIEIIELLLEKGADIKAQGEIGQTPLMDACAGRNLEVIEYLLNKGADINASDRNGTTALMYAAGYKKPEAVRLLLKRGANPKSKDRAGRTFQVYVKRGFPDEYVNWKM